MDCTCGGNPNCFKCDGSGIVRSTKSGHIIKGTEVQKQPINQRNIRANNPSGEVKHSLDKAAEQITNTAYNPSSRVICPYCSSIIRRKNVMKHLSICPNNPIRISLRRKKATMLRNGNLECPHCRIEINPAKYSKHVSSRCNGIIANIKNALKDVSRLFKTQQSNTINPTPKPKHNKKKKGKKKGNFNVSSNNKYGNAQPSYQSQYKLDGSNGLHVARDNGRYGSYSSHDDYGEEANL